MTVIVSNLNAAQWIGYILACGFLCGMCWAVIKAIIYRDK